MLHLSDEDLTTLSQRVVIVHHLLDARDVQALFAWVEMLSERECTLIVCSTASDYDPGVNCTTSPVFYLCCPVAVGAPTTGS
jgi:hypothetical protein